MIPMKSFAALMLFSVAFVPLVLLLPVDANYTATPIMTPLVDRITGAALILDHAEHDIHEARSYTFHFESSAPLPTNATEETAIGFITPAATSARFHFTVDVQADDESVWELREDPVIVVDQGTAVTVLNRERSATIASFILTNETVPVRGGVTTYNVAEAAAGNLAGGTILHSETLAAGGGAPFGSVTNTQSRAAREFILLPETEYVIIVTSSTANNTIHHIIINWSEDIDGDFVN
jgi:hypothetical protein